MAARKPSKLKVWVQIPLPAPKDNIKRGRIMNIRAENINKRKIDKCNVCDRINVDGAIFSTVLFNIPFLKIKKSIKVCEGCISYSFRRM